MQDSILKWQKEVVTAIKMWVSFSAIKHVMSLLLYADTCEPTTDAALGKYKECLFAGWRLDILTLMCLEAL